ncbi:MAG: carboxypeptidase-like regulatory domain-containing protein [Bryobacteraceae bacterium]|jgi:hypothetical protein
MRSAILFVLICRCLAAQDAAAIEGVAIDAVTRQPMAGVHIALRAIAQPTDLVYGAISRQDGHFSVATMPPGIYFVAAQRNGYVYAPADHSLTLKLGERRTDFTVEMTPRASITGCVVDEYGDPIQHVGVRAIPLAMRAGLGDDGMYGRTDERGQFRMTGAPGKFYVRANATREGTFGDEINSSGPGPAVYGETWYPDADSKDRASVVEVAAGHDLVGIDIHLTRQRTLSVGGAISGAPENSSPSVVFFLSDESGLREFMAGADGKFKATGLRPGHYRIMAQQNSRDAVLRSPFVDLPLDSDKSDVSLALQPGETITGALEISGVPATTVSAQKLTVRLESLALPRAPDSGIQPRGGEVDQDGAFRIERVFPEKFRVRVFPMPENGFIQSVKLDNIESKDDVVDLSRGVNGAHIKVTVNPNGGQLEGAVLGENGSPRPATLAFVVLAATPEQIDDGHLQTIEPGGKFRYTGLRPGKYRLMAVEPPRESDEFAALKAIFPHVPEIEIREGDRITKDITLITPENPSAKP